MSFLFGGGQQAAPAPTKMPDMSDPSVIDAQRRRQAAILSRSGRSSTILTRPSGAASSAGTTSYANSVLGQS